MKQCALAITFIFLANVLLLSEHLNYIEKADQVDYLYILVRRMMFRFCLHLQQDGSILF